MNPHARYHPRSARSRLGARSGDKSLLREITRDHPRSPEICRGPSPSPTERRELLPASSRAAPPERRSSSRGRSAEISRDRPRSPEIRGRPRPQALQKTCIVTWMGKKENNAKAQAALTSRSKANSEACKGAYVAGSCPSIGAKGNVEMQGGAY